MCRFGLRYPRLFWIGLPILAALCIGNYWEYHHRSAQPRTTPDVAVRTEDGKGGHANIGISEGTADAQALTFALLGSWNYQTINGPPCPPEVQSHHGQQRMVTGFMYPLAQADTLKVFCLLRTTQTCCFGPRPQFNQYLFVETRDPVPFERQRPVQVVGTFQVDPQPMQGYIYRLENATVTIAPGAEDAAPDPATIAQDEQRTLWDWSLMEQLRNQDRSTLKISPALLALQGQGVVVQGFVHNADPGPPAQYLIGFHPPPGRPDGKPPTLFDALTVQPTNESKSPPAWQDRPVWRGKLHIVTEPDKWDAFGLIMLEDASVCSAPQRIGNGPILPNMALILLLACFLMVTVSCARTKPEPVTEPA